jgi:hypothetical protein
MAQLKGLTIKKTILQSGSHIEGERFDINTFHDTQAENSLQLGE